MTLYARQTLRPYQVQARDQARAEFSAGRKRIIICLPTGAGKTTTAADMIDTAQAQGKRVLFLAHRRELIEQASGRLEEQGIEHGVIMRGSDRWAPQRAVQVASIQTLLRRELPPADLVFVDECHLSCAPSFIKVLDSYPDAAVIGLTATPYRLDGKGLGRIYQALVECVSVADLIESGSLVRPTVLSTPAPDLAGVKTAMGDYAKDALAAAMDRSELIGDVVEHWLKHAKGRRTVVFASSVKHSMHLAERFRAAGVRADHIDADTPGAERKRILGDLRSGALHVVCNVEILTAGWDLPALEVCVLARPTQSLSLYLQMVGRVLRPKPTGAGALILDHAGCVHAHGLPDEPRSWSLIGPKDKHTDEPPPSITNCPDCYASLLSRTAVCPICDYPIQKSAVGQQTRQIEEVDGQLVEITAVMRMTAKRNRFTELVMEARRLGYRDGWAVHRYKAEVGMLPAMQWLSAMRREA